MCASQRAGYLVLIDPDKWELDELAEMALAASEGGADAILIGGSLLLNANFDEIVRTIRAAAGVPCLIFPGSTLQISRFADAILFLSLVSGQNPNYLIGEQIKAAPLIKNLGLESIPTGYMLIESGRVTSAEFMSNTRPIPRDKNDIAKATALAAEFLGMKLIYLEAGSGAQHPVPIEMVRAVSGYVDVPVIVGGGVRTPAWAAQCVEAGASFVVTGNILEKSGGSSSRGTPASSSPLSHINLMRSFAEAIHNARRPF
jgi:phosphoglycerol geranylgeranyltransferase